MKTGGGFFSFLGNVGYEALESTSMVLSINQVNLISTTTYKSALSLHGLPLSSSDVTFIGIKRTRLDAGKRFRCQVHPSKVRIDAPLKIWKISTSPQKK